MKTLYFKFILPALILLGFAACDKDGEILTISTGDALELVASATTVDMDATNSSAVAVQLNWTALDVQWSNPDVATEVVTYTLQLSKAGLDFKDSVETVDLESSQTSYAPTFTELNDLLIGAGCTIGEEAQVELRLVATVAPNSQVYSNVITLTATPFNAISYLYVPGAYQSSSWDIETAESLVSPTSNGIYTGIIYFPAANSEFKITLDRTWDKSYGEVSDGQIDLSASNNIKAPRAGNLQLTVNINDNTIAYEDFSWGIIGSASPRGWDTDTDMKYDNANKLWKLTVSLSEGEIKFRKNHGWDVNLGGSGGTLTSGGDNIAVSAAGTYTIVLDVENLTYTIEQQ